MGTANYLFKAFKKTHVVLEDIIRKRILDRRFDDTPVESHTKHNINSKDLSEMKSKKKKHVEICEEVYTQQERRYSAQKSIINVLKDRENREKTKIIYQKLCSKLNRLTFFHMIPKFPVKLPNKQESAQYCGIIINSVSVGDQIDSRK